MKTQFAKRLVSAPALEPACVQLRILCIFPGETGRSHGSLTNAAVLGFQFMHSID